MPASPDSILLSDVRSLTLRGHGALTSHRRVSAVPQLKCVSDPALCRVAGDLDVMRCSNSGSGYSQEDIQVGIPIHQSRLLFRTPMFPLENRNSIVADSALCSGNVRLRFPILWP